MPNPDPFIDKHCVVHAAGLIYCGAIVLARARQNAVEGAVYWLNVNSGATRIPQMYRSTEITVIATGEEAAKYGLCPECLGFGTNEKLPGMMPTAIDELKSPCPTCAGSGRAFLRVHLQRTPGGVSVGIETLTHDYLGPDEEGAFCYRCGTPKGKDHDAVAAERPATGSNGGLHPGSDTPSDSHGEATGDTPDPAPDVDQDGTA